MPGTRRLLDGVTRVSSAAIALGGCMLGVSILAGGEHRLASPAFRIVRLLMPWWAFGSLFAGAGLAMAIALASRRHILWAALPLAAGYGFFASALLVAAATDRHAGWTGIPTYGTLAALTTIIGWFTHQVATHDASDAARMQQLAVEILAEQL